MIVRISKRLLKRIAIGFGIALGLLLIVNGVLAWMAQHRLDQKIAELRAAGEPVALADLAQSPISDEKNAAVYIQIALEQTEKWQQDYYKFEDSPRGKLFDDKEDRGELPNADEISAIRATVDAYPTVLAAIEKAAACEDYVSLLDFKLNENQFLDRAITRARTVRSLFNFAHAEMIVLTAQGKADDAVRLGAQMLRLARLIDREPLLMNHLVALGMRGIMFDAINLALRHNSISPAVRVELDAALASLDTLEPLKAAIRSEPAYLIPLITEQTGGGFAFIRWTLLNRMLGELDVEYQAYQVAQLPLDQIRPQWNPVTKQASPPQFAGIKSGSMATPFAAVFVGEFRHLALSRCLRVLNELGNYRAKAGKDAESIEQLALPRGATIDPWSGQPLHIKMTTAGFVVYSVWQNGVDDGGRFDPIDGDWGFGPPGYWPHE
jgi:hypothetical protein